ncbi:MAG: hypothetical protein AB8H03_14690 [Saprospiraceae bacterium]
MIQLSIPIPNLSGRQDIDIAMTVNGQKQKIQFRVEVYEWDDCKSPEENRIECIRNLVEDYKEEWMVYNIGIPNDKYVPLTFVKISDWERQRLLMLEAVMRK